MSVPKRKTHHTVCLLFCVCVRKDTTSFCNFSCKHHFSHSENIIVHLRKQNEVALCANVCYTTSQGGDKMSLQTVEISSVKIIFDKEKTKEYCSDFNKSCDCQDCRNYYEHIEENKELHEFLCSFGIDYNCTEEVFSWDLGNDNDSLIHHEGYYVVFGKIEGKEFDFEKFGVKITFLKAAPVPCDWTGEHFWICIEGDFPYILGEEREFPISFSQKIEKLSIFKAIKSIFKKI